MFILGLVRHMRSAPPAPFATAFCNTHARTKSRPSSSPFPCGERNPLRDNTGRKHQTLRSFPNTFGKLQVDKACSLTQCVVQLLTYPFLLRILAAKPCFYGTTLSVCDTGSPRASASDRTSSSVQGTP